MSLASARKGDASSEPGPRPGRSRRLRAVLVRLARLLPAGLALFLVVLLLISSTGRVDWQQLADRVGEPWDALLNPRWAPKTVLLLAALGSLYLALAALAFSLDRQRVRIVLGEGTVTAFARVVRFGALLAVSTAGYLLFRVSPDTLRVDFPLHGDTVSLTLPTLLTTAVFGLAALALPPGATKPYLPRRVARIAFVVPFAPAAAVALSLHHLFPGAGPWDGSPLQTVVVQLALVGVEATYLLTAAEAFLADLADFHRLRSRGQIVGAAGLGRTGVRLALFLAPVLAGLWLAAGAVLPSASILADRDGQFLGYYHPSGVYRVLASANEIPDSMKRAVDAIEDPGAYTAPLAHVPVNPTRLAGIFIIGARTLQGGGGNDLSGGSGIAVQSCKNFSGRPLVELTAGLPDWFPLRRPLALLATVGEKLTFEFECGWAFERASLLLGPERSAVTFYLNQVYFGRGAYGVQAAALTYFGKQAKDLTSAEVALLAGLPQAPSALDPWSNGTGVKARRAEVLAAMVREGYLPEDRRASMDVSPLGVLGEPYDPNVEVPGFDRYTQYLMQWLDAHGFQNVSTSGLVVVTSIDRGRQQRLSREVRGAVRNLAGRGVNNGAAVVLDPRTGEVLAWFGGTQPAAGPLPDLVTAFPHQPGSAIKPMLYACALEEGKLQPDEELDDTPRVIGGKQIANWDLDPVGRGMRPAREELAESRNTAAAELADRLTPSGFAACLKERFHVQSDLHPDQVGVDLGLGLVDLPMLELAAAYTALANDGVYVGPTPVVSILDSHGRELYRTGPPRGEKVLGDATLQWVSAALADVSRKLDIPSDVATKTGSTPSSSFVAGYGRGLLAVAWLGRTEPGRGPLEIDDVEGQEAAWSIWRAEVNGG